MLAKAHRKLPLADREVTLVQGEALKLLAGQSGYEAAILNLILSVIPDAAACLSATLRALKPGGRVVIFDKFLPDEGKPTLFRRATNLFSTILGTDINRRFADIRHNSMCNVLHDEASIGKGLYRIILLQNEAETGLAPGRKRAENRADQA